MKRKKTCGYADGGPAYGSLAHARQLTAQRDADRLNSDVQSFNAMQDWRQRGNHRLSASQQGRLGEEYADLLRRGARGPDEAVSYGRRGAPTFNVLDVRHGGVVPPGPRGVDTVPAMTSNGLAMLDSQPGYGNQEFVLPADSAELLGLDALQGYVDATHDPDTVRRRRKKMALPASGLTQSIEPYTPAFGDGGIVDLDAGRKRADDMIERMMAKARAQRLREEGQQGKQAAREQPGQVSPLSGFGSMLDARKKMLNGLADGGGTYRPQLGLASEEEGRRRANAIADRLMRQAREERLRSAGPSPLSSLRKPPAPYELARAAGIPTEAEKYGIPASWLPDPNTSVLGRPISESMVSQLSAPPRRQAARLLVGDSALRVRHPGTGPFPTQAPRPSARDTGKSDILQRDTGKSDILQRETSPESLQRYTDQVLYAGGRPLGGGRYEMTENAPVTASGLARQVASGGPNWNAFSPESVSAARKSAQAFKGPDFYGGADVRGMSTAELLDFKGMRDRENALRQSAARQALTESPEKGGPIPFGYRRPILYSEVQPGLAPSTRLAALAQARQSARQAELEALRIPAQAQIRVEEIKQQGAQRKEEENAAEAARKRDENVISILGKREEGAINEGGESPQYVESYLAMPSRVRSRLAAGTPSSAIAYLQKNGPQAIAAVNAMREAYDRYNQDRSQANLSAYNNAVRRYEQLFAEEQKRGAQ